MKPKQIVEQKNKRMEIGTQTLKRTCADNGKIRVIEFFRVF